MIGEGMKDVSGWVRQNIVIFDEVMSSNEYIIIYQYLVIALLVALVDPFVPSV